MGGAPDEGSIPPNGNSHPLPNQEHFHPNQENHIIGPFPQNDPRVAPAAKPQDAHGQMNIEEDID